MTRRDLAWRGLGAGLLVTACGAALMLADTTSDLAARSIIPAFIVAIAGLVLLVQGKRVAIAFRAECSRHRRLPAAIHANRRRERTTPGTSRNAT